MEVAGKRVTLMGLGRHGGGIGAARWLTHEGAAVTITDLASAAELAESRSRLVDLPIAAWRLGEHDERDFRSANVVVVNPAVQLDNRFVQLARERGAQITSEIELFLRLVKAPVVGVTGTVGKSTTAAMLGCALRAAGRRVWVGGNIGRSLLPRIRSIRPDDIVVLELSSFQLAWLSSTCPGVRLAIVTNLSPNHLDWHGSLADYRAAKARLLTSQSAGDLAVLGSDESLEGLLPFVRGRRIPSWPDGEIPSLGVPGDANRANAAMAAAAASAIGCPRKAICRGLAAFRALRHRLALVAEFAERRFYNDSKATTPAAALAAMQNFGGRCWVILGGYHKGGDLDSFARAVGKLALGAASYGAAAEELDAALTRTAPALPRAAVPTLAEAVTWCWKHSRPGDAVLLSPACASFGEFSDYIERGERFEEIVSDLARTSRDEPSLPKSDSARTNRGSHRNSPSDRLVAH